MIQQGINQLLTIGGFATGQVAQAMNESAKESIDDRNVSLLRAVTDKAKANMKNLDALDQKELPNLAAGADAFEEEFGDLRDQAAKSRTIIGAMRVNRDNKELNTHLTQNINYNMDVAKKARERAVKNIESMIDQEKQYDLMRDAIVGGLKNG